MEHPEVEEGMFVTGPGGVGLVEDVAAPGFIKVRWEAGGTTFCHAWELERR